MVVVKSGVSIAVKRASVIPNEAFLTFTPSLPVKFSPERYPYSELWEKFSLTATGSLMRKCAGFSESGYYHVRRGVRKASPAILMSVCMLSKVPLSFAKQLFHDCRDTDELESYGAPAAVLAYLLYDIEEGRDHNFDAFIWYSIVLNNGEVPEMFRRNPKWTDMANRISEGVQVYDLDVPNW